MIFEGHEVEVLELNGQVLFNPYHVAECLEISDVKSSIRNFNNKQIIKVKNSDMHNMHFRKLNNAGENFLTESGVYKLVFKSRKPNAEAFTDWITDTVLPTIRKTGGYVHNDDLFIETYLPFADDNTKALFSGILSTVRKQNEVIRQQKQEIEEKQSDINHKEDVINNLMANVPLAEMRQVLNKVVKYKTSNFQDRWQVLYREFELKYHCNLKVRLNNYNKTNKTKCKSKLDYIDKVMNQLPDLYELACKLYESDVKTMIADMYHIAKTN